MKPNAFERIGYIDEFLANLKGESRSVKTKALNQSEEKEEKSPKISSDLKKTVPSHVNKYIIAIAIVLVTVIGIIITQVSQVSLK